MKCFLPFHSSSSEYAYRTNKHFYTNLSDEIITWWFQSSKFLSEQRNSTNIHHVSRLLYYVGYKGDIDNFLEGVTLQKFGCSVTVSLEISDSTCFYTMSRGTVVCGSMNRLQSQSAWIRCLALLLTSCCDLGQIRQLSVFKFSHSKRG